MDWELIFLHKRGQQFNFSNFNFPPTMIPNRQLFCGEGEEAHIYTSLQTLFWYKQM